jgi:aryl-alcohol dehydrogenase-like predicted oxidoreductase
MKLSRREMVKLSVGAGATVLLGCRAESGQETEGLLTRPIPSSGERIPIVGIGTARRYNVETEEELAPIRQVLLNFPKLGGKLVDTAPGYGNAETVVGDLIQELGNRDELFLATKVAVGPRRGQEEEGDYRQAGIDQMEESMRRLYADRIDLMQVHNLRDVRNQLATLREWKQEGRFRYIGMTTSSTRQYGAFETVMREEDMDFVQVDYSMAQRSAEERLLPLAADRGMGVLINLPYRRGVVFRRAGERPLPDLASEFDCESWGQFFLKFVLSHPAVSCVIPGTAKMEYLVDNLGAARGRIPDAALRQRMVEFYDALPEVEDP